MSGAAVEVKGLVELQKRLAGLAEGGVMRVSAQVAIEAKNLVGKSFREGVSPDGEPWEPIKYRAGQPLRDSGRLAASVVAGVQDTGSGFTVSTNVVYGAIHNFGGVVTVKKAKQLYSAKLGRSFGKSVKIPKRQFLPGDTLPAAWAETIREVVEDAVEALFP